MKVVTLATYKGKPFTEVSLRANILAIGRELERQDWSSMSSKQAEAWCLKRAKEKGVPPSLRSAVAYGAMKYVIGR